MKASPLVLLLLFAATAFAHEDTSLARYLGNEGVMVEHGETKVLFDPFFRDSYGQYERVPEHIERALFEGDPPYDGIDAIFVSHFHGDHFSPAVMLDFLRRHAALVNGSRAMVIETEHGEDQPCRLVDSIVCAVAEGEVGIRETLGNSPDQAFDGDGLS